VLAAGLGFLFVDEAGSVRELAQPEAGRTEARTNDGACDPQGRFWAVVRNTNFRLRPHAAHEMLAPI
jgi:sugar lactone lactonase YvrE